MLNEHDAKGPVSVVHGSKGERGSIDRDVALGDEIGQKRRTCVREFRKLEEEANRVPVWLLLDDSSGGVDMCLEDR